jgi:hypothetical protein
MQLGGGYMQVGLCDFCMEGRGGRGTLGVTPHTTRVWRVGRLNSKHATYPG